MTQQSWRMPDLHAWKRSGRASRMYPIVNQYEAVRKRPEMEGSMLTQEPQTMIALDKRIHVRCQLGPYMRAFGTDGAQKGGGNLHCSMIMRSTTEQSTTKHMPKYTTRITWCIATHEGHALYSQQGRCRV